jgi:hypothetical protein
LCITVSPSCDITFVQETGDQPLPILFEEWIRHAVVLDVPSRSAELAMMTMTRNPSPHQGKFQNCRSQVRKSRRPHQRENQPSKQQTKSTNSLNRPMAKAPAVAANKKSTNVARSKNKQQQQQQERREVEERRKAEERKAKEAEAKQHKFVR